MPRLIWLDLETTGLSPHEDAILEVAFIVADLSAPFTALQTFSAPLYYTRPVEEHDEVIQQMHTKNHLFEACARSTHTLGAVMVELLKWLPQDDKAILAGSSVHFDRYFLRMYAPALSRRFSHKLYDVSAIKLFCESLGMPSPPKVSAHRALPDIKASIALAEQCANWLFTLAGRTVFGGGV